LPIDFSSDAVGELARGPLDVTKTIFVSWLGVTQYLTRTAVDATLRAVGSWGGGSEITLSYIGDDWTALEVDDRATMEHSQASAAAAGEPWLSRFSSHGIADLFSTAGFARIEPFTIEAAKERYFRNRADKLLPSQGIGLVSGRT